MWAQTDGHDTIIPCMLRTKTASLPGRLGLLWENAVYRGGHSRYSLLAWRLHFCNFPSLLRCGAQLHAHEMLCVVNNRRLLAHGRRCSAPFRSLSSRNSMRVISMAPRSILRSLGGCEGSCSGVTKHWGYVCRSNQASGARHTYVYALLTPGTRLMEFAIRMCTIATATQHKAHA